MHNFGSKIGCIAFKRQMLLANYKDGMLMFGKGSFQLGYFIKADMMDGNFLNFQQMITFKG
jgi:hypothetical protein